MELESREAIEALKNYKAKNLAEELVVELLLTPSSDKAGLGAMADKIVDSDLSTEEVENLHLVVGRIRKEVGIDPDDADYGMTDYESSDIEYLKNRISDLEPAIQALELEAGSKLRQAERVRRECDQAARECLELSLADLKDSDASSRLRNLREKQDDLMEEFLSLKSAYKYEWCNMVMLKSRLSELIEEFLSLKSAYKYEWCNMVMLKSRLSELIEEQEVEVEEQEIKEREYNPDYDIPDEFFAIAEEE